LALGTAFTAGYKFTRVVSARTTAGVSPLADIVGVLIANKK
jgi:hypothetical protein